MANPSLTRANVQDAHRRIQSHIHKTPVMTNRTLDELASTPQSATVLADGPWAGQEPARPQLRLFFKCENLQRVGAFKVRGAFHALSHLDAEQLARGVITHSSGNHAQALALAAREHGVQAYVVMPKISTPSKIAATKGYGAQVLFSGSTEPERLAVVNQVIERTQAHLVPPYDHPHIILGQGTLALELQEQAQTIIRERQTMSDDSEHSTYGTAGDQTNQLNAVIAPCGGGGMLSGIATALIGQEIRVFGAEPSYQGADDCRRGLAAKPPQRITHVSSLTIADGVRTPVGAIPWTVISDPSKVQGVFAVTEDQIRQAMRLVLERMKLVVEPSAVLGLAVALYNEDFRRLVEVQAGQDGWNLGIVLSGGNTTVEAIGSLLAERPAKAPTAEKALSREESAVFAEERHQGTIGSDGSHAVANVAG